MQSSRCLNIDLGKMSIMLEDINLGIQLQIWNSLAV